MSIDRAATLRQAEKLLRQGKLEQAIAEYLGLVEDQPRDWNTANLLGDLYVRAGHLERAIEQFARIAEHLRREGFLPRASALYKKILKLKPDSDHALMRAGELAAEQGLLADARTFFSTAAAGRKQRGDSRGALQVVVRMGSLDREDVAARQEAARARLELDDAPGALHEFNELAAMLIESGRDHDALAPLRQVVGLDPANAQATKELTRILIQEGQTAEAAAFLSPDAIGNDPRLLLVVAEMRLRGGETGAGLELLEGLLASDPSAGTAATELSVALAATQPAVAFAVADTVAGSRIESASWSDAAQALWTFVEHVPNHVAALTRLVDICIDGGLQEAVVRAQALLADAYLAAGTPAEAKCVAEDLIARQPWQRQHFSRLRAALAAEGHADPDRALADWLAETPAFGIEDDSFAAAVAAVPAPEPHADAAPQAATETATETVRPKGGQRDVSPSPAAPHTDPAPPATSARNPHAIDLDLIFGRPVTPSSATAPAPVPTQGQVTRLEEDLSSALDGIHPLAPPLPAAPSVPAAASPAPAMDLESVFARMRDDVAQRPQEESADAAYTRGAALFEAGELEQSIEQLRAATRSPRRRFAAASMLARIYEQQKRTREAVDWLGHAIDVPDLAERDRLDTLFRLAELLESTGERERALAVCLELQADAGDFRDVNARIARLSRAQGGG